MTTPLTSTPKFFIGVAGRARHGKTGFAKILERMFSAAGYIVHAAGFSDPILKEAHEMGLIDSLDREKLSPREIKALVFTGTERRRIDSLHWIKIHQDEIDKAHADVVIVHGVRFPMEVSWVRQNGGVVIRLVRRNADGTVFISEDRDCEHPTESVVFGLLPDYEIVHFAGQELWLEEQAKALARFLMRPHPRFSEEPVFSNVPKPFRSSGGCAQ